MRLIKELISKHLQSSAKTNATWLIVEKLLSMAVLLLVSVLIARQLGPESYGRLSYLLAIVALILPLSSLGLNALVTRELVKLPEQHAKIMSTVIAFRFISGLVAFGVIYLITTLGGLSTLGSWQWAILLLALVNVLKAVNAIDFWFQAKVQSKYVVKARFLVLVIFAVVKVLLVILNASLVTFIWFFAFEILCNAIAFIAIYLHHSGKFSLSEIDFTYGKNLLTQSKWLIFSGIAAVIYLKIDQIMLAEMVSTTEVGIYSVASRMSEIWYFFPVAIVSSFFPALLAAKDKNEKTYQASLQKLCDALFVGAFIIAIIITLFSDWLVVFLFGEHYQAAGTILSLHVWAGIFVFMRALLSKWLLAENLVSFSLLTHGVGAIVNIALNMILIPLYQGQGAAIATVISYAFAAYFVLFFHSSTRPMAIIMTKSLFLPSRIKWFRLKLFS